MDEAWERAVEAALGGQPEGSAPAPAAPRSLTLDGAVKCLQGRLPAPAILERFQSLEHLSIANVGVFSLEKFPRLGSLTRLILSDNRIAGGLEHLVSAGLESLRDLDLSNNRIQFIEDLAPLAQLRLVSLDLYECPVTRVKDYRSRVFGLIRTLKYLDKMDADENERPESDDEEEDEEEEEEEEEDPGSGEVDGEDRDGRLANGVGGREREEAILDAAVDEDESEADEEGMEIGGRMVVNGLGRDSHHMSNGFRVEAVGSAPLDGEDEDDEDEEEDVEDEEEDEEEEVLGEEIDEEEVEEEDVVEEVHAVGDSDQDEDGVEEEVEAEAEEENEDYAVNGYGDEEEDDEDVEDEEDGEPGSTGLMMSTEGEIDGHEQGEEDENGEIGEEDEGLEDREYEEGNGEDEDEEEDVANEYLVQPISQPVDEIRGSDIDAYNEDEDEDGVDDDDEEEFHSCGQKPSLSSYGSKRKRDDDGVEDPRSSSKHRL